MDAKGSPPAKTPPGPAQATAPQPAAPKAANTLLSIGLAVLDQKIEEKKSYLKMAFNNPYNLSLLGGALAAAGVTLNPVLAIAAVGLEALWLMHAPDSKRLRMLLWDPRFEQVRLAVEQSERAEKTKSLSPAEQERVEQLVQRQQQIQRIAQQNPSFTGELLRAELHKTYRLVDSFVEMAVTCNRYEQYLSSVDSDEIEHDRGKWEMRVRGGKAGEPQTVIAQKNLAIILKRLEKIREIRSYLTVARGQLDLIENSFQLIADQIVTMNSPAELSGQLDELLDGVESIRETAIDTEKLLGTVGADP
jgi:hypothetical protein